MIRGGDDARITHASVEARVWQHGARRVHADVGNVRARPRLVASNRDVREGHAGAAGGEWRSDAGTVRVWFAPSPARLGRALKVSDHIRVDAGAQRRARYVPDCDVSQVGRRHVWRGGWGDT